MKKIKCCLPLLILVSFLISCSSDDDSSDNNNNDAVIGTWDLVELNVNPPQDINGDGTVSANIMAELDCVSGTWTVRSDNTWNLSRDGVNVTSITGNRFNIICASNASASNGTWQLQNNSLTLVQGFTTIFLTLNGNRLSNTIGEDLPQFSSEVYEKR